MDTKKYIIALDEGTTSARAIMFDKKANIISMAQHEIKQIYPHPSWVEQDPMDIYANQYAALTECIAKSGISPNEIASIGITNQRETVIVWDKNTGKPIKNAIVWQCRRTADICKELEDMGYSEYVSKTTGLRLDPYFSGTKIKWILDNVENARERAERGELLVGTVDTWIVWKLTEGKVFVTDRTNASRTMLYNIHENRWDEKMLEILNIPACMLPDVRSSSEVYGYFNCMGEKIAISGIAGDQQAALFGQCCFEAGSAKNTYGTGCFLLANTGNTAFTSKHGLLTTVAATAKDEPTEYVLEGSVFVGGAIIRWLRDEMKLIHESKDSEYFARQVSDCNGVYLVPAFSGLGAPYWDMNARGNIVGLTAGSGRNHIIRAALESIAYQTQDVIEAMNNDMQSDITCLKVDGGASANDLLMQMQSNYSNIEVHRSSNPEATAMGAAFLAGLAVGFYKDKNEIKNLAATGKTFEPNIDEKTRKQALCGWKKAIKACKAFGEETGEI